MAAAAVAVANGDINANDIPVLALLPIWIPNGYGKPVPTGDINDQNTKAVLQNQAGANLAWARGMIFLIDDNNGKSMHLPLSNLEFGEYVDANE